MPRQEGRLAAVKIKRKPISIWIVLRLRLRCRAIISASDGLAPIAPTEVDLGRCNLPKATNYSASGHSDPIDHGLPACEVSQRQRQRIDMLLGTCGQLHGSTSGLGSKADRPWVADEDWWKGL